MGDNTKADTSKTLCGHMPYFARGYCYKCYFKSDHNRAQQYWRAIKSRFGVTRTQYDKLYRHCGGVCCICGRKQYKPFRYLDVDHNHKTGKVRGLLCRRCNQGLGFFQDDPTLLKKAVKYLVQSS